MESASYKLLYEVANITLHSYIFQSHIFVSQTGEGLENFWKVLVDGRNCSVPIPRERFDLAGWYDPDDNKPGKSRTAKAALIDGYVI